MRSRIAEIILGIGLLGFVAAPEPAAAQKVIDLGADTFRVSHGHRSSDVEVRITTKGDTSIIIRRSPGSDSLRSFRDSDIVRTGENIIIDADQVVGGDVVSIGGSVTVSGRVRGDAVAILGDVTVKSGGSIDGDAVSIGGRVNREPGSHLGGQNVGMGFVPAGIFAPRGGSFGPFARLRGISLLVLAVFLLKMLFVFGVGWAARALAGSNMDQFGQTVAEGPWRSLLVGLASHFALGLLILLVSITVIGLVVTIPAGIALIPLNAMSLALIAALLGQRVAPVRPGGAATPRSWTGSAAIGLGMLSLPIICGLLLFGRGWIPNVVALVLLLFGGTVLSLAGATGFGAMVLTVFRGRHRTSVPPPGTHAMPPTSGPQMPVPPTPPALPTSF
jgi:hypothetical protein